MSRVTSHKRDAAKVLLALTLAWGLAGCSANEVNEGAPGDAVIPPAATTDPVPQTAAETPPPATTTADASLPTEAAPVTPPAENSPATPTAPPATETLAGEAPTTAAPAPAVAEAPPAETPPTAQATETTTQTASTTPVEPTAAPVAPNSEMIEYTTQPTDTLMKIAFETYGDLYKWKDIYNQNKDRIADPNHVPKGTLLRMPRPETPVVIQRNGERYHIKRGDTLGSISRELYGTPSQWKALWKNNRQLIKNPNRIYAGFDLYYRPLGSPLRNAPLAETETPATGAAPQAAAPITGAPREPAAATN